MLPEDNDSTETEATPSEETLDYEAEMAALNEKYDRTQQPEQTTDKPKDDDRVAQLERQLAELRQTVESDTTDKALAETYRKVRGDGEYPIPAETIDELIHGRIAKDPVGSRLWMDRRNNPQDWSKYLDIQHKWLKQTFGKKEEPDNGDVAMVEASVRGQTTQSAPKSPAKLPENPSLADLNAWEKDVLG